MAQDLKWVTWFLNIKHNKTKQTANILMYITNRSNQLNMKRLKNVFRFPSNNRLFVEPLPNCRLLDCGVGIVDYQNHKACMEPQKPRNHWRHLLSSNTTARTCCFFYQTTSWMKVSEHSQEQDRSKGSQITGSNFTSPDVHFRHLTVINSISMTSW